MVLWGEVIANGMAGKDGMKPKRQTVMEHQAAENVLGSRRPLEDSERPDVSEDKELVVVHHTAVTEGEKRCQTMGG